MAPYEAKYGLAPDVGDIKTWGCVCYTHIPAELREKGFTDKSYRGYFLGVHEPTGSFQRAGFGWEYRTCDF